MPGPQGKPEIQAGKINDSDDPGKSYSEFPGV